LESYDLQRFLDAQEPVLAQVCAELRAGQKQSHWMWFIFPQIAGLGHSTMAQHYAIASLSEARAYDAHQILGERLRFCTGLVNAIHDRSARQIFGVPDDMKFRSCMTLFAHAAADPSIFDVALKRYFAGEPDLVTLAKLAG